MAPRLFLAGRARVPLPEMIIRRSSYLAVNQGTGFLSKNYMCSCCFMVAAVTEAAAAAEQQINPKRRLNWSRSEGISGASRSIMAPEYSYPILTYRDKLGHGPVELKHRS